MRKIFRSGNVIWIIPTAEFQIRIGVYSRSLSVYWHRWPLKGRQLRLIKGRPVEVWLPIAELRKRAQ